MKYIYILAFLFITQPPAFAQQKKYTPADYAKSPVWISMIKDTATNFFEAEKAFKTYFAHHARPTGENEDMGSEAGRKAKHLSRRELKKIEQGNRMRMEVKRYEHWRDMVLTYVQPDGRILTPAQRLQIHQQIKN
jgi:hypothetical protein